MAASLIALSGRPLRSFTTRRNGPSRNSPKWSAGFRTGGPFFRCNSRQSQSRDPMKYLIVNGDDFGASGGINRGIVEAHCRGILTSTSLLVDSAWSGDAAKQAQNLPRLGVGLHIDLPGRSTKELRDGVTAELERQLLRFKDLMGCPPTHLDSHRNVHRAPEFLFYFLEFAREHELPLREHSGVRYLSSFYGRWGAEEQLEQIRVS